MRALNKWFVVLSLAFVSPLVIAASFDNEFDEKPWAEIDLQLPAFPEKQNLIPFKVGSVTDKQFFIDEKSITVGADEVIRYSLVVVSSAGAQSISFEGMRCLTGERRVYAFGHSDNTWSKARSNKWVKLQGGTNNHHVALFADYFCTVGAVSITKPEDAIRILRYSH